MDVFLGGAGEGKRNSRARNAETMRRCFAGRCEFRTALCVCYILYVAQWKFRCCMFQTVANSALDPRGPGAAHVTVQASTTRRPVYASIYVKGLLLLVPPPRSCVYVAYAHAFYVVMCYMSITCICQLYVLKCYMSLKCYVSVLCLVLAASCICICLLYVVICYMSLKCICLLYV